MENKEKFINKVIEIAQKNVVTGRGGPFAAIIVKDNNIISLGRNQVTSKIDPTLHAEIDAIRKATKKLNTIDLSSCSLYSSCEPCPMCLSAIYWANIKKVYYAADRKVAAKYGFIDEKIYNELKTKVVSVNLVCLNVINSDLPFKVWKSKEDKIKY